MTDNPLDPFAKMKADDALRDSFKQEVLARCGQLAEKREELDKLNAESGLGSNVTASRLASQYKYERVYEHDSLNGLTKNPDAEQEVFGRIDADIAKVNTSISVVTRYQGEYVGARQRFEGELVKHGAKIERTSEKRLKNEFAGHCESEVTAKAAIDEVNAKTAEVPRYAAAIKSHDKNKGPILRHERAFSENRIEHAVNQTSEQMKCSADNMEDRVEKAVAAKGPGLLSRMFGGSAGKVEKTASAAPSAQKEVPPKNSPDVPLVEVEVMPRDFQIPTSVKLTSSTPAASPPSRTQGVS